MILSGLFSGSLSASGTQNGEQWSEYSVNYWNTQTQINPVRQSALRSSDAWLAFRALHGTWYVEFDEITGLPHRAAGPAIPVSGGTMEEQARYFLDIVLKDFSLPADQLVLRSTRSGKQFHYVDFYQTYEGLEVLDTRVTLRMTPDQRVPMFGVDCYPEIRANTTPLVSAATAALASATGIAQSITQVEVLPELALLPVPGRDGMEFRLVYRVNTHFEPLNGIPGFFESLVDARSGELLSRVSRVHNCSHMLLGDVEVNGTITDNPGAATEERGLPYLRVNVGGTDYYTDANGLLSVPSIVSPTPATVHMDGLFARVSVGAGAGTPASFSTTLNPGSNVLSFDASANARERSAYFHTNFVHDFSKLYFPAFTTLDFPFTVRVDRTDGDCNAFYDGSSINFYAAGGGCPATALFSDVVYHEYGHGLNYDLYNFLGDPSGMGNGAMQEGYADIWGLMITGNPILGDGFSGAGTDVRRYDIDPKRYPEDLVGQVHADGEIIAGAWWDFGVLRSSLTEMTELFLAAYEATIDGPSGDEGSIYRDVLLEALLQDDDDADLSTGTPRDDEIITAFGIHGISLLANIDLDHSPALFPDEEPIVISAELDVDFPAYLGEVSLLWRIQGASTWTEQPLTEVVSASEWRTELPAQPEGTILEYYFEVEDIYGGRALTQPANADATSDPNLPYFALVGFRLEEQEDFDLFAGDWVIDPFGTDDASTGRWEIEIPQASNSSGFTNQPGLDHSPDNTLNFCLVTGHQGYTSTSGVNFDVDGGETSVRSPDFDATQYTDPVFSFYRWFSNDPPGGANPGNDPFEVFISNDGSNYTRIRNTFTSDASWRQDVVRISDYVSATPTVSLLFMASDRFVSGAPLDGGSLVEALVDDLYLYGIGEEIVDTTTSGLHAPAVSNLLELFPNPSSGAFQLTWSGNTPLDQVMLYNASGQLVYTANAASNGYRLSVPDMQLPDGVYTVVVTSGSLRSEQPFLIQH